MSSSARDALRAKWRADGRYPDLTIGEAIGRAAAARHRATITFAPVHGPASCRTLDAIHQGARSAAGALVGAGVGPGEHVILQAPADARSTEVLVGLWLLGAVVVPLSATATRDEVAHAIRETNATTGVAVPSWRGRELVTELHAHGLASVVSLADEIAARPLSEPPPAHPWDDAAVIYTSGSTAAPKGVRHTHETLLFGMTSPTGDSSTTLATFPAGHVASLLGLLRPLTGGGTTVVMDRWSARHAAELIEAHRVTASAGTPFFLSTLLEEAERSGRDIGSLTRFMCGAAPVPPRLVERAEAAGIVTWRTYGSTEHPAIASGTPDDPLHKRMQTDGRPSAGNEVRLVDELGRDVDPGEEGEIVARGPKQFVGYVDPAADVDAFVDETWFRTGDLARFDDDGYLVITDRIKDIIIRGGENISAREIEEALATHANVREVAVSAEPDEVFGESVAAFVVAERRAPSLDELVEHARRAGLAAHKLPTHLTIVDRLPRTAAGKVRKRELRSSAPTL